MLVWGDLETTGLDPNKGSILEIALVVTDDNFNLIAEPFVSLVKPLHLRGWEVMNDAVRDMHTKSGLIEELYNIGSLFHGESASFSLLPGLPRLGEVERAAIEWLHSVAAREGGAGSMPMASGELLKETPLAGSSIHFDKGFLREHMDELEQLFSHRIFDVSVVNEWMKRFASEAHARRPGLGPDGKPIPEHRALPDILKSIETARYQRRVLFGGAP
jgi:oligoribonuclease